MCGRIGSGFTPPKYGFRSWWISVTRIRPPPRSRLIQPAPAPHIGSTRTLTSAALSASRSRVRRRKRSYPSNGSKRSTIPAASASAKGRRGRSSPPLAAIPASMTESISGPAAEPAGDLTLKPLSVHGLWLAVMTTPADAPRSRTSYELICVGTARSAKMTLMSRASSTSAAATAKCSDAKRRSYAITTPRPCSPRSTT